MEGGVEELDVLLSGRRDVPNHRNYVMRVVSLIGMVALVIACLYSRGINVSAKFLRPTRGPVKSASPANGIISEIYNDKQTGEVLYENDHDWLAIDYLMGMRSKLEHVTDGPQKGARRVVLAVEWLKQRARKFDRNSDGSLNLAEFTKWWPASDDERIKRIFEAVDQQGKSDDALSIAELSSFFRREDGIWTFVVKDRLAMVEELLAAKQLKQCDSEAFLSFLKRRFAVENIKDFEDASSIKRGLTCSASTRCLFYKDALEQDREILMKALSE